MERYRFHADGAHFYYLHNIPVRKGLVRQAENWRFSSARHWASGGKIENDVLLSCVMS